MGEDVDKEWNLTSEIKPDLNTKDLSTKRNAF